MWYEKRYMLLICMNSYSVMLFVLIGFLFVLYFEIQWNIKPDNLKVGLHTRSYVNPWFILHTIWYIGNLKGWSAYKGHTPRSTFYIDHIIYMVLQKFGLLTRSQIYTRNKSFVYLYRLSELLYASYFAPEVRNSWGQRQTI